MEYTQLRIPMDSKVAGLQMSHIKGMKPRVSVDLSGLQTGSGTPVQARYLQHMPKIASRSCCPPFDPLSNQWSVAVAHIEI